MKMNQIPNLILLGLLCCAPAKAEETHEEVNGMALIHNFPPADGEIDFEDVRKNKHLSVSEVVECADRFLKAHFGEGFRGVVFGVSYIPMTVKEGRRWCWAVRYVHPQKVDEGFRVFTIYLDQQGKPFTEIKPADTK